MPERTNFGWFLKFLAGCLVAAVAVFWWLLDNNQVMRQEARARFFEQYNRQQLLMAQLASRTIEDLFATMRRHLGIVVSLFEQGPVTPVHAQGIARSLQSVFALMGDMPIIDLVVFDRFGDVIAIVPEDPFTLGRNYAWRDYFRWARDEGTPGRMYLSPFLTLEGGQHRGDQALIVAQGIYGAGGEFKGVAMFTLNFDELARSHVMNVTMGERGYAWLVDTTNQTVLIDPRGRVGGQSFDEAFGTRWPKLYQMLLDTRSGKPGMDWYDFEDPDQVEQAVRKLVGFAPVRIENRLWTLGVCTPEPDVEALLASYLRRTETFSTTALVAVFGAATILVGLLLHWNRALRSAVEERAGKLAAAHARLESTFEELAGARRAATVGQLALGLVHEIRNPLSAIRMNVQMIRKRLLDEPDAAEHFVIVEGEIARLNELLGDVMSMAKPRTDRREPTDLGVLIDRVLRLVAERIRAAEVEVVTTVAPALPPVACDPEQIHQVILNLVLNAVEALEAGDPPRRLTLTAEVHQQMAQLTVRDTGPGIPREAHEKVFEPFYTGKAQGVGLGLAIVENIVSRHGGTVAVEPTGESVTALVVRLPLSSEATEDPP